MDQIDQIALMTLSAIGGAMFVVGAVRVYPRGMRGLVTRHKDGSALTPEEKRAQSVGLWRALWDPAHRLDLGLVIGGLLIGSGFLAPLWWGVRAVTG
jgi:hypothetical protein